MVMEGQDIPLVQLSDAIEIDPCKTYNGCREQKCPVPSQRVVW